MLVRNNKKEREMVQKKTVKKERITPRDAASAASMYFNEVAGPPTSLTIEEIELSDDKMFWLVTLGYSRPGLPFYVGTGATDYKVFKVDAYSGEVLSMKIR